MEKQKYIEDLKEIREIMDRSSRFISLSGLSGVAAGIIALIGAWLAYRTVYTGQNYLGYRQTGITNETLITLLIIALATLLLAIGAALFFTRRKAKKEKQKLWDMQARRLLVNLFIPLAAGGLLCLILLFNGYVGLVAPLTLIFYGLALVNASKYTLSEIRSLGLMETGLGLLAAALPGYGLLFWAIGFGVVHIIYGIIMQARYGS